MSDSSVSRPTVGEKGRHRPTIVLDRPNLRRNPQSNRPKTRPGRIRAMPWAKPLQIGASSWGFSPGFELRDWETSSRLPRSTPRLRPPGPAGPMDQRHVGRGSWPAPPRHAATDRYQPHAAILLICCKYRPARLRVWPEARCRKRRAPPHARLSMRAAARRASGALGAIKGQAGLGAQPSAKLTGVIQYCKLAKAPITQALDGHWPAAAACLSHDPGVGHQPIRIVQQMELRGGGCGEMKPRPPSGIGRLRLLQVERALPHHQPTQNRRRRCEQGQGHGQQNQAPGRGGPFMRQGKDSPSSLSCAGCFARASVGPSQAIRPDSVGTNPQPRFWPLTPGKPLR